MGVSGWGTRQVKRRGLSWLPPSPAGNHAMIDLYYWPTPNGHKPALMLAELAAAGAGLEYRIVPVDIGTGAQFEPAFLAISPNNKMPAIVEIGSASCRERACPYV